MELPNSRFASRDASNAEAGSPRLMPDPSQTYALAAFCSASNTLRADVVCENVRNIDPQINRRSPLISLRLRGFHGGHASCVNETPPGAFRWTRGGVTLESVFTGCRRDGLT
jgi:hypothetical protein